MTIRRRGAWHTEAVVSTIYWDFQPGQRVMTVDKIPGTVKAVQDGAFPGQETYDVVLDNGLGGGSYGAGDLADLGQRTAAEVVGTGVHLATEDYPELGSILDDRPDPGKLSFTASAAGPWYHGTRHELAEGDVMEGGKFPSNQGAAQPGQHVYYTGRPDVAHEFAEAGYGPEHDPDAEPKVYQVEPVHGHEADPDEDSGFQSYRAPSVRVIRRHAAAGPPAPEKPGPVADQPATGLPESDDQPSACSYCGGTDFEGHADNGRVQQATCSTCGGTMSAHPGAQWTPELIGDPSNHPNTAVDPASGASTTGTQTGINDFIDFNSRGTTLASLEVTGRVFDFSHDEQDTGGTKFPTKHTLKATDADSRRSGGSVDYFPPKRKGGPVHVDRLSTDPAAGGAGSALMNEIENRHPGSPVKFVGETGRDKNTPSHADGAHGDPTDWDTWHKGVEYDGIHRGFAAKLDPEHASVINNPGSSKDEHLNALHKAIPEGPNLGMHWTADAQQAKNFAHSGVMDPRSTIPVVLHAQGPARKDIETRPDQLFRNGVFPFDHGVEKEVPMRRGRQVKVTGISWKPDADHPDADRNGWLHHTYPEGEEKQHTAARAFSWDEIGDRHPHVYGDSEIHGEDANGADGPGIGDAANYLAHERPGHQDAEDHSVHDLNFHEQMVHPRHIDYSPSGSNDPRVQHAREGYQQHPHEMPPLVLVHRHGVYQVADGHHRAEAAAGLKQPVRAYVAHSPYPDEPFADGDKGPFHGAKQIPKAREKKPAPVDQNQLSLFGKKEALSGHDWCTWRRAARCTFPGDSTAVSLAIPQDRGPCPWETPWQQQVCPISEPGPMALMQAKGSIALPLQVVSSVTEPATQEAAMIRLASQMRAVLDAPEVVED